MCNIDKRLKFTRATVQLLPKFLSDHHPYCYKVIWTMSEVEIYRGSDWRLASLSTWILRSCLREFGEKIKVACHTFESLYREGHLLEVGVLWQCVEKEEEVSCPIVRNAKSHGLSSYDYLQDVN